MKRSDALAPLSRDHHRALKVALRARRTDDEGAAAAAAEFVAFMAEHGEPHFRAEERELLPLVSGELAERTRREHADLRARAEALGSGGDAAAVQAAGEALHDHVRFEERLLFPELERTLSDEQLAELAERLG